MRRFSPVTGIWGLSRIDADDQARYFLDIDEYVRPATARMPMPTARRRSARSRRGFFRA
jgi:hypothetical protein